MRNEKNVDEIIDKIKPARILNLTLNNFKNIPGKLIETGFRTLIEFKIMF